MRIGEEIEGFVEEGVEMAVDPKTKNSQNHHQKKTNNLEKHQMKNLPNLLNCISPPLTPK